MPNLVELAHRVARILLQIGLWLGLTLLFLFWGVLGWFRWVGVPEPLQNKLKSEFERRGLILTYDKLYLDGHGDFVVKEVRLFSMKSLQIPFVEMSRLNLQVEWLSWWRGTPFLQGVGIEDADLQLPLSPEQKVFFQQVNAQILFQHQEVSIQSFQARFLNTRIFVEGEFPLNRFVNQSGGSSLLSEPLRKNWGKVEKFSRELVCDRPLEIRLKLSKDTDKPSSLRYEIQMNGSEMSWRNIQFQKLIGSFIVDSQSLQMPILSLERKEGAIRIKALAEWEKKEGWMVIDSRINPGFLATFLPEAWRDRLIDLKFDKTPLTQAEIKFSWKEQFQFKLISDLDWRGISCQGSRLERLQLPLAFEKDRFFIPEAVLQVGKETIKTKLIYEKNTPRLEGEIFGKLDPTALKGFLPVSFSPFLNSCRFTTGADLALKLKGTSFQKGAWDLGGNFSVKEAFYKGIHLPSLESQVVTDFQSLTLKNLLLQREEGEGRAAYLKYDFQTKLVQLQEATAQLQVQEMAHLFGGNFEKYCEPYRFQKAPWVRINEGSIDLGGGKKTQLYIKVTSGKMTYPFLGAIMPFEKVETDLSFNGLILALENFEGQIYQGKLSGKASFDFAQPKARFESQARAVNMEFGDLMQNFFQATNVSGILNGTCSVRGEVDNLVALKGSGEATVEEGYLMSIPFLGGLAGLLNTVIPDFGYAKAKQARTTFTLDRGYVMTDNLQVGSVAFNLIADGNYDFVHDNLDLDARVNLKGPVGIVLFPVSKLFEYHGTGPLSEPVWKAKVFGERP